jgi:chemotaxis signal transduction protein
MIIFLEIDNNILGFYVEKVKEFISLDTNIKIDTDSPSVDIKSDYLKETLNYEGRKLYLPDFKKIIKSFL